MFNRSILKDRAKHVLAKHYWQAFLLILIVYLISLFLGGMLSLRISGSSSLFLESPGRVTLFYVLLLFNIIFSAAVSICLIEPCYVGVNKFMLCASRGDLADITSLGYAFRSNYKNILKVIFMKNLIIFAFMFIPLILIIVCSAILVREVNIAYLTYGSQAVQCYYIFFIILLYACMIPGLMKYYDYYLVGYILADNPDISWRDALKKSKNLMRSNRFATFILNLSFIGWLLLGTCLCGVGAIFVFPYIEATNAQLYLELTGEASFETDYTQSF